MAETPKHIAHIDRLLDSLHRGGSCRVAVCTCGWHGPERGTLELAADDALTHEGSGYRIAPRKETHNAG